MEQNYVGFVAEIKRVDPIPSADNIHIAYVLGEPVVVSKNWGVGKIGLFFPTDTQLSEEFTKSNNLFRDSTKNADQTKTGFFDANRKVRAQPFLKVKSCGFFCELSSLDFTGSTESLQLGDKVSVVNGIEIARKYVNPNTRTQGASQPKKQKQNLTPLFEQHMDTNQFKYYAHLIEKGTLISIQAKKHGTSFRSTYTKCLIELPKWKKVINKVLPIFPDHKWDYVTGTRRVVLKNQDTQKEGFHGKETYRFEVTEALKPFLAKGMTVYGEIVGFVNGSPIMGRHDMTKLKDKAFTKKYGKEIVYRYGCNEQQYDFYIYRIAMTNDEGISIDFSQKQLVEWCLDRGFKPTQDVVEPFIYDGDQEKLVDLVNQLTEREELLCEDYRDPTHISEGVIVRCDNGGLKPKFYKSKSFPFRCMESNFKDNNVDLEDES